MSYALGVDVGGTKVSVSLGSSQGKILAKEILPTQTGPGARATIEEIAATLRELKIRGGRDRRPSGIGVCIPGPMNPQKGVVERSPHLRGWSGFPLKNFLEKKLGLPVFIANDANAAALGEKIFGEGRAVRNFVYLTVSTGIGSGILLENRLLLGSSFGAGEVGHTMIVPDGERCGCGHQGCLEAYASGTAIAGYVKKELSKGRASRIRKFVASTKKITAEIVSMAAEEKDGLALEAFRHAGHFLGIGLANLINLLNPQMLILGGSVMKSSRFLWPAMKESVGRHAWPTLYRACRIVKTKLGDRVGDLGALALAFRAQGYQRPSRGDGWVKGSRL